MTIHSWRAIKHKTVENCKTRVFVFYQPPAVDKLLAIQMSGISPNNWLCMNPQYYSHCILQGQSISSRAFHQCLLGTHPHNTHSAVKSHLVSKCYFIQPHDYHLPEHSERSCIRQSYAKKWQTSLWQSYCD